MNSPPQARTAPDRADATSNWRFCVAPMMDWTDRHCRYFHRQLSRRARLYTEMITATALIHGDAGRLLAHDPLEQPLALQLGGSEPAELAAAARLGEQHGYAEINLNCGCPSERVQRGAFGACLMAEPALVAECFRAIREAVRIPVTVKHRIGLGRDPRETLVEEFVGTLAQAGCRVFIVHARNAWLEGLSPRENREVPPLRYEVVERLKAGFPEASFVLNGGVVDLDAALAALERFDGVMLGRAAYHDPYLLAAVDRRVFGGTAADPTRAAVVDAVSAYVAREAARGTPPRAVLRHVLGLYQGRPGARRWRRDLSDPAYLSRWGVEALARATAEVFGTRRGNEGEPGCDQPIAA